MAPHLGHCPSARSTPGGDTALDAASSAARVAAVTARASPALPALFSLFPLFLAFLSAQSGNLELLVVYYVVRVLGRQNAQALARYEGRSVPTSVDALVAKQEALLLRKEQEDLFATVGFSFVFLYAAFFGVAAFVVWQATSALFGVLAPPPDPLAF